MKIGMLTSGGDCQGLNAALRGVAKALYQEFGTAVTIYGIRDGYRGLIEGDYHPMEPQDFSDILTRGGTILGSSFLCRRIRGTGPSAPRYLRSLQRFAEHRNGRVGDAERRRSHDGPARRESGEPHP